MSNVNLNNAKQLKNDEFYTRLEDIESELVHYTDHLVGKTVYCNCDNPEFSNFWKYFTDNFKKLRLKRLISTYIVQDGVSYKYEMKTAGNTIKTALNGNGDFRSDECVKLLQECDIVITNPPFSLFREYSILLYTHNKDFLVIGNYMGIALKQVFLLYRDYKLYFGVGSRNMIFNTPTGTSSINATWFTSLAQIKKIPYTVLHAMYCPTLYPVYDKHNAIHVKCIKDIPSDYFDAMGVPVTFLKNLNRDQFEVISVIRPSINGKNTFIRAVIKQKRQS